jgi:hypothetical protein
MGHRCFISFKTEDLGYKEYIQNHMNIDMIDKSLNVAIDSENEDYIMRKIREEYLSTSTVTIHLIGSVSSEKLGAREQRFIKRELQASLYNGEGNTRNGILGVVLPVMYKEVFLGSYICPSCGDTHNTVAVNDDTVVREFSYNYYVPNHKCVWTEEDRYCVLAKWDDFEKDPEKFIEQAFQKRRSPIASRVKVRP